ncbi:MAG TPA: ATP-binding protein [Planctomycetota bacterium]|nr:ATP-binding protein [Planctomycetota bacterium]
MAKNIHREMTVPCDTTYLSKVRLAVLEIVGEGLFSPVKANLIALAVDEAVANIMEHAYPDEFVKSGGERKDIDVILDATPVRFEVIIRDRGITFDPREVPEVDMQQHVKAGRKGGLGIFLIRRIMDEIHYHYKQGSHNELQMVKYVEEKDKPPAPAQKK